MSALGHAGCFMNRRMRVCLTRKLAGKVNGVDLAGYQAGDVLDLPAAQALLLVAEGWAVDEPRTSENPDQQDNFMRHAS